MRPFVSLALVSMIAVAPTPATACVHRHEPPLLERIRTAPIVVLGVWEGSGVFRVSRVFRGGPRDTLSVEASDSCGVPEAMVIGRELVLTAHSDRLPHLDPFSFADVPPGHAAAVAHDVELWLGASGLERESDALLVRLASSESRLLAVSAMEAIASSAERLTRLTRAQRESLLRATRNDFNRWAATLLGRLDARPAVPALVACVRDRHVYSRHPCVVALEWLANSPAPEVLDYSRRRAARPYARWAQRIEERLGGDLVPDGFAERGAPYPGWDVAALGRAIRGQDHPIGRWIALDRCERVRRRSLVPRRWWAGAMEPMSDERFARAALACESGVPTQ